MSRSGSPRGSIDGYARHRRHEPEARERPFQFQPAQEVSALDNLSSGLMSFFLPCDSEGNDVDTDEEIDSSESYASRSTSLEDNAHEQDFSFSQASAVNETSPKRGVDFFN
jgi:hypothetical protein